jgi:hypothetical protein
MSPGTFPAEGTPAPPRRALAVWLALAVLSATFALGARSWVVFFLYPGVANGVPVGLFTQTDYPAIAIASRIIQSGRGAELYDLEAQRREQTRLVDEGYLILPREDDLRYPYPYTPFIALLMSPFAGLSPLMGMAIWDLVNVAAYAGGLWLLLSSLSLSLIARRLLLLGGLTSFPFIVNLEQGQSSGLVMLALGLGIGLLKRERDLQAGLALGLLALKIQWLPLIGLVLIWKLRWRALLGIAVTGAFLTIAAFLIIGTGWLPGFIDVLGMAQSGSRELLLDPDASHSLLGGIVALLGAGAENGGRIVNLLSLLTLAGVILYLFRDPWRPRTESWDGKAALTMLAAMLTNPHLNTHDLSLLIVPAALGLSSLNAVPTTQSARYIWYLLIWAAYLVPAYLFSQVYEWPLKLTTLIMLVMVVVLIVLLLRQNMKLGQTKTSTD